MGSVIHVTDVAFGDLLPSAVGIALSPIPIAAVILMLFSPKARTNGPVFVIGWLTGLVLVGGAILLFGAGSAGSDSDPSTLSLVVKTVLGVLLLLIVVKQWRDRSEADGEPETPKWMKSIDSFTAGKAFGIAVLLSGVNPKNLAMNAAGVVTITQGGLEPAGEWAVFAVFVLISSLSVMVPVAYYFIAGKRAEATLDSMKVWLIRNNATIMGVLLLVFGVKLLTEGIQGLFC
jgi:hypothetical protein